MYVYMYVPCTAVVLLYSNMLYAVVCIFYKEKGPHFIYFGFIIFLILFILNIRVYFMKLKLFIHVV